jgi:hypothetical protein
LNDFGVVVIRVLARNDEHRVCAPCLRGIALQVTLLVQRVEHVGDPGTGAVE